MLYDSQVKWITLDELIANHQTFGNHPFYIGAVDASVQKIHRPREDQRLWYSGKHKCHCIKVQAMVSPSGFLTDLRGPEPGSVHDCQMYQRSQLNARLCQERDFRARLYPGSPPLGVLFDKGYTGVVSLFASAVLPFRKPPGRELNEGEVEYNRRVGSDRIVVERWFGRHKTLWGVMSAVFPLRTMKGYETVYRFCAALTNLHIAHHPLVDYDRVANDNITKNLRNGGAPEFPGGD